MTFEPTPPPSTARYVLLLGALMAMGPLTLDMYLPAFPAIVRDFATSSSVVQLTLTGTLIGLAVGQIVVGPLSDAVGRRKPLLCGVGLHVAASGLIMMAPSIELLGFFRLLQGFGGAVASVLAMAVVRDLFAGRRAAIMISRLMLVMGLAPILAPTVGSQLLRITDWRGIFAALGIYGVVVLIVLAFALRETLPPEQRRRSGVRPVLRSFGVLLRDRTYVGLVLVAALSVAGMFGYISGASFVFQGQFHFNPQQFGLVFGGGAASFVVGTQINGLLLRRYEPTQLLLAATVMTSGCGVVLVVLAATGVGGAVGVFVPIWLLIASVGLATPNAPALALSLHGERAGAAAALLGAGQFGVGAVTSPIVGLLGNDAVALGVVLAGSQILALSVMLALVRPGASAGHDEAPPHLAAEPVSIQQLSSQPESTCRGAALCPGRFDPESTSAHSQTPARDAGRRTRHFRRSSWLCPIRDV